MNKEMSRAIMVLGVLLALGMSVAAFILGVHADHLGSGRQTITVKGLAEKPVQADYAEWNIGVSVVAPTLADTLAKLRAVRPDLDVFLAKQGFDPGTQKASDESAAPNMVEDDSKLEAPHRQVQKGFIGTQTIVVTTKDLVKIAAASKAALEFQASGHPIFYTAPSYLVSKLEDIKMSLIGAATQNAQKRAEEFAKNGNAKVGSMHAASQGAFYILAAGSSVDSADYGGAYDKSTPDKTARVVVTIDYNIER
jgi:hypothetical protein